MNDRDDTRTLPAVRQPGCIRWAGGRVVLIQYRGEDPAVPILPLHKTTAAQSRKEMSSVGLEWVETRDILPQQHFMVFRKPG